MTKQQSLLLIGMLAIALLPGRAWAQAEKRTQTADIRGDIMTFNWNSNTFEFIGNAKIVVADLYNATMTGSKLSVELTSKNDRVKQLVAFGPVRFELISDPDKNGVRHRVVATADDRAEYTEITQKIVLRGNACATSIALPETPESQRVIFEGDVMEADLGTGMMTATPAHMQVTSPIKEAPAAQTPAATY